MIVHTGRAVTVVSIGILTRATLNGWKKMKSYEKNIQTTDIGTRSGHVEKRKIKGTSRNKELVYRPHLIR